MEVQFHCLILVVSDSDGDIIFSQEKFLHLKHEEQKFLLSSTPCLATTSLLLWLTAQFQIAPMPLLAFFEQAKSLIFNMNSMS